MTMLAISSRYSAPVPWSAISILSLALGLTAAAMRAMNDCLDLTNTLYGSGLLLWLLVYLFSLLMFMF